MKREKELEKPVWSVMVIHGDEPEREKGVTFCDELMRRFWDCEFDFYWWSFDRLRDAAAARVSSKQAAIADLIVFALREEQELPADLKAWVETWMPRRTDREGLLIYPGPCASDREPCMYLRRVAHRGCMDFLTELPVTLGRPLPESLDHYSERAGQVTTVLDEILRKRNPPVEMSATHGYSDAV